MTNSEGALLTRPAKSPETPAANAPAAKRALVLDMGEASRAQGFRENGCR